MLESPPRPVLIDDFTHHRFKCEIERVVISNAVKTNFLVTLGGLRFSLPVSGNGFLSWDSIVQVEWSQTWRWFVLHTSDGQKL